MSFWRKKRTLTASPMFLAIFESVMFAKGLSAPQHSTYFVIFDEGLVLDGIPGVAINGKSIESNTREHKGAFREKDCRYVCMCRKNYLTDARRFEVIKICNWHFSHVRKNWTGRTSSLTKTHDVCYRQLPAITLWPLGERNLHMSPTWVVDYCVCRQWLWWCRWLFEGQRQRRLVHDNAIVLLVLFFSNSRWMMTVIWYQKNFLFFIPI